MAPLLLGRLGRRSARPPEEGLAVSEGLCQRPIRCYQLLGNQVTLSEGDAVLTNTGWKTWAGSWLLAKHLEVFLPRLPEQPRRILDLSCGTGLAGVALAKAGYEVVLCDLAENVALVRENLARNAWKHPEVESAQVVDYAWGRPLPEELQGGFDLVLCGDLLFHVWNGKLQTEFMQTLQELCRRRCRFPCRFGGGGPAIVFAGQVRSGRQESQVVDNVANRLGYLQVPLSLDPNWFSTSSPLLADAKYRIIRLEPAG
mmetsp:Transcript_20840/g.34320  ORF Transcript_20840/g.34320 Transcript_20840/m.34320 type:complete len:257 (+) Transcript_20840:63-833(+)